MVNTAINNVLNALFSDVKINNTHKKLAHNQSVDDIAKGVLMAEWNSRKQIRTMANQFKGADKLDVIKRFHAWQRKNLPYKAEPSDRQNVKEVNRILHDANTGNDCKHYATITMSFLRALGVPAFFRMVSQNPYSKIPTHIYVVAKLDGKNYVIDPCMSRFNEEDRFNYKYDIKPINPLY